MIISASRRTDIPSYYSQWFINRLKAGYVLIPNPFNTKRYSKVILTPEAVDCIVFWTKNPLPMMSKLPLIHEMGYPYYFQFTLTPYDHKMECGLPNKQELMISFQELSRLIGTHRIIWRYDPIIVNQQLTVDYHIDKYTEYAKRLSGYTKRCVISFVDDYRNIRSKISTENQKFLSCENVHRIAKAFGEIAEQNGITLTTCSEEWDLSRFKIHHGSCIDKDIIESILGTNIIVKKDKNQRPLCGCIESIDIGTYDTCGNGCQYCYAVRNHSNAHKKMKTHNPKSPLLIGEVNHEAIIKERDSRSVISGQTSLI